MSVCLCGEVLSFIEVLSRREQVKQMICEAFPIKVLFFLRQ